MAFQPRPEHIVLIHRHRQAIVVVPGLGHIPQIVREAGIFDDARILIDLEAGGRAVFFQVCAQGASLIHHHRQPVLVIPGLGDVSQIILE